MLQTFGLYTTLYTQPPYSVAWLKAESNRVESKKQLLDSFMAIVRSNSDRNRDYIMSRIKTLVMPGVTLLPHMPFSTQQPSH